MTNGIGRTGVRPIALFACLFLLASEPGFTQTQPGLGSSVKMVSGCEIDLTGDSRVDMALAVETSRGNEAIALIASSRGYTAVVLSRDHGAVVLRCERGKSVRETSAGSGRGRVVPTLGTYLVVDQLEGAKAAYLWNGKKFVEVWIAD